MGGQPGRRHGDADRRRSRRVIGTDSPGIDLDGLGAGPSGVWVADDERGLARVIDPAFRTVARTYRIERGGPDEPRPVAVTPGAVWVSFGHGMARLDPARRRTVARIPLGNSPSGVAVGAGGVWVSDDIDGTVSRIDPATNDVLATIPVGASASGIAAGAGGVWVAVPLEDRVKRIDPATNAIAEVVRVGGGPAAVALGAGALWVTSRRAGTVTRIDPRQARIAATIRLGDSPQGVAVAGGAVWVTVQAGAPATAGHLDGSRRRPARAGARGSSTASDPARLLASTVPVRDLRARCSTTPTGRSPRERSAVPRSPRAMPTVTDGGRTYTFRLRSGFRFSPPSGAPVTAAAFERRARTPAASHAESGAAAS